MPVTSCTVCGVDIPHDQSRCPRHRTVSPSSRAWHRPGSSRLRAEVLARDGGCVVCGSTVDLEVHHRIPVHQGGAHHAGNLERPGAAGTTRTEGKEQMAFWNRKKAESRALPPPENQLPYLWHSGYGIGDVTPSNATGVADAFACIRLLAESAGSLPLIPYRRIPGGRERLESGKLADLLQRPAPGVTQSALITQLVAHLNLWGNAYLGKYRRGGDIVQLGLLQPDRVQVEVKNGEPRYRYMPPTGPAQTLTTRDVLHVKALTTDGLLGLSPIQQAKTVLGLSDTLARHAASTFGNNATPRGVLRVDDFTSDDTANEALRDAWEERHQGPENAGLLAVTSGQVEFQPIAMPFDDAQFIQQRKLSAVEVARVFRVPPHLIGADPGESLTYSNVESQALEFVKFSLRPWLVAIEQAVTNDTDLTSERQYVEFLLDALLRADSDTRSRVYERALDPIQGWMTRAEVRRLENLEPESAPNPQPITSVATTNGAGNPDNVEVPS